MINPMTLSASSPGLSRFKINFPLSRNSCSPSSTRPTSPGLGAGPNRLVDRGGSRLPRFNRWPLVRLSRKISPASTAKGL